MTLRNCTQAIVISAVFGLASAAPAFAADPTGDWQVEGGFANIRVAECSGAMWGAVAWEKTAGNRDKNNPDASKRTRPTLGIVTLFDMKKKSGADEWNGKVYDARDSGKLYSASIRPKGVKDLEIEGCLVWPLCGAQTWTRVAPPIPSSSTNSLVSSTASGAPRAGSGTPPKPAAPKSAGTAPKALAPGQTADIGDICLLPEITGAIAARPR